MIIIAQVKGEKYRSKKNNSIMEFQGVTIFWLKHADRIAMSINYYVSTNLNQMLVL